MPLGHTLGPMLFGSLDSVHKRMLGPIVFAISLGFVSASAFIYLGPWNFRLKLSQVVISLLEMVVMEAVIVVIYVRRYSRRDSDNHRLD